MPTSRVLVPLTTLAAVVLAVTVAVAAADDDGFGTFDGSCATGAEYRSAVMTLDARSGEQRWRRTLPHPRDDAPEVADGLVLLRGCGAEVLDLADGTAVAHRDDEEGLLGLAGGLLLRSDGDDVRGEPVRGSTGGLVVGSSPPYLGTTLAGPLLVAHDGATVTVFDVASGGERWSTPLPSAGDDVLLDGDALVVLASDGSVYRLDATTGAVGWRAIPAVAGELGYDRLVAVGDRTAVLTVALTAEAPATNSSAPSTLVGLDLRTGRETWRRDLLVTDWPARGMPVVDGTLAVTSAPGVRGLDLATGRDLWEVAAEAAAPVAAAGAVVVDDATSVLAVDPRTGAVQWRRATAHHPLLGTDPQGTSVVIVDSPEVPYGMNDCC